MQLAKTKTCRIGVGARATLPANFTFFVEVNFALSSEDSEVDLQRLENLLLCLKELKVRGYKLMYDDGNIISCETEKNVQNLDEEYQEIKKLVQITQI